MWVVQTLRVFLFFIIDFTWRSLLTFKENDKVLLHCEYRLSDLSNPLTRVLYDSAINDVVLPESLTEIVAVRYTQ